MVLDNKHALTIQLIWNEKVKWISQTERVCSNKTMSLKLKCQWKTAQYYTLFAPEFNILFFVYISFLVKHMVHHDGSKSQYTSYSVLAQTYFKYCRKRNKMGIT